MFIVHTKLYSENAYPVIAASNIAKDRKQLVYSLDKDTVKTVERTRNGLCDYHNVLRLPDGEVVVFGFKSSYSLPKVHGEIIDFIAQLQNAVDEDERFFILPPTCSAEHLPLKKALSNACLEVSSFMPWGFIYEKDDVDHVLSRPLTLREIRNVARQLGKQDACLDPLLVEQRRLVLSAVARLYRCLEERYDSKSRKKSAFVEIANRYTVSLPVKHRSVPVVFTFPAALPRSLDFDLRKDIHRFIDDGYHEGCIFGMENPTYEHIAAMKAELDEELFDSEEYKDFLSALKIDTADFPRFPSPALIACQWSDYDNAMKISI